MPYKDPEKAKENKRRYRAIFGELINERRRIPNRKAETADRIRARDRARYAAEPGKRLDGVRSSNVKVKIETIDEYGGVCAICGEFHIECLTLDHSFNDGSDFRKSNVKHYGGSKFYKYLRKLGYPKDLGLRVLCFNCNCSIGAYGYSPYENT